MLIQNIREKLRYLGDGIVDASTLLNHQVDVDVLSRAATAFSHRFQPLGIDKVLTIEVSGIVPALLTARDLGVPMVYARKGKRITQGSCYEAPIKSRTTAADTVITVDQRMLSAGERVLVVDDFLARGEAVTGIAKIIDQAQAKLQGVAVVFEKGFEGGRERLRPLGVPVCAFVRLHRSEAGEFSIEPGEALHRASVGHLHLHVGDLARSKSFYCGRLGMSVDREYQQLTFLTDGRGFELALQEDNQSWEMPPWFHFGFPLDSLQQLEATYEGLKGDRVVRELQAHPEGYSSFRVRDPDGYVIEFYTEAD